MLSCIHNCSYSSHLSNSEKYEIESQLYLQWRKMEDWITFQQIFCSIELCLLYRDTQKRAVPLLLTGEHKARGTLYFWLWPLALGIPVDLWESAAAPPLNSRQEKQGGACPCRISGRRLSGVPHCSATGITLLPTSSVCCTPGCLPVPLHSSQRQNSTSVFCLFHLLQCHQVWFWHLVLLLTPASTRAGW